MKGYKATYGGYCRDHLYEVGETYEIWDDLKKNKLAQPQACKLGFHFCEKLEQVFRYYSPTLDIKVFKVEALGEVIKKSDKHVTNKILIIEEADISDFVIIDKNMVSFKDINGNPSTKEYNDEGIIIHYKSKGYEYRTKWCEVYQEWDRYEVRN
tara:strand:+ start:1747 stop:2208 length:462 start_codon:yes stop_codon:yes gene_type:complete